MSILTSGILITRRGFLVNTILFSCLLTLYYVFSLGVIQYAFPASGNRQIMQMSFNFVIAITLLSASFFVQKMNKLNALYVCLLVSSIVAVLLFFASSNILRLILILIVAICLGIGQLTFSTYFWDLTVPEERGRIGGLIGFISMPFYFTAVTIAETLGFLVTIMLSVILSLGVIIVILLRPAKAMLTAKKNESESYPEKRTIFLYSIPWIIFSVINATIAGNMSVNIMQQVSSSFYFFLNVLQLFGALFGTIIGGIIADFFGRRLSLAFSLTLYGTSSAVAGLLNNDATFSFAYIANGLSWGIFLTLYIFVVFGDLANKENCGKMYSIGLVTFYLVRGVAFFVPTSQIPLVISSLLSCLLIFLSNVPLILALELLPLHFREKMKLKLHMQALKKVEEQSQN